MLNGRTCKRLMRKMVYFAGKQDHRANGASYKLFACNAVKFQAQNAFTLALVLNELDCGQH